MMKKRLIIFVALLVVLLGIGSAQAASSFSLGTEQASQETCPTMFTTYQFTVINTGDEIDTYTVSKSGSAAAWALTSPPGFVLAPGNSQSIFVYVTPAKGARTGTYELDITVTADKAGPQSSSVSLDVGECHALTASSQQTSQTICTGELTSYELSISNLGQWSENTQLSLAGSAAPWSSLSYEYLRLNKGESGTITVSVEPRANEVGDFDLTVTARSLESNALTSQNFDLRINGCYGMSLTADENFASFCENSEVKIPIILRNTGTATNTYDLSISGAEWSAVDQKQVSLAAGESRIVNAVLFPGYGIYGKYNFKLVADSIHGDDSESVDLTANVLKCHDVGLTLSTQEDKVCPRTLKTYTAEITNTGTKSERFSLALRAPSWVTLDKTTLSLSEGESTTAIITVAPTQVIPGKHPITLEVQSIEGSSVSAKGTLNVEVASESSCFGVRTIVERSQVRVAYGEGTLVPIVVENVGSETETYSFDISGDGVSFAQLNPSSITVNGNSADTTYLYIAVPEKTEKESYSIIVSARDESGVVSSSNTIYVTLTSEPTLIPELQPDISGEAPVGIFDSFTGSLDGLTDKLTGFFVGTQSEDSVEEPAEPVVEDPVVETPTETPIATLDLPSMEMPDFELPSIDSIQIDELLETYKFWVIGAIVVMMIIALAIIRMSGGKSKPAKSEKGIWKRFTDWLEDEDFEEIELVDSLDEPKSAKQGGLWKRFTDWLEEEDDDLKELYKDTAAKPAKKVVSKPTAKTKLAKSKPVEKGAWQRFTDWLEEEDEPVSKPTKTVAITQKKKPAKAKPSEKGAWQRFVDWLDEEDEPVVPKTVTVTKKEKPKAKPQTKKQTKPSKSKDLRGHAERSSARKEGTSFFQKFNDWLDEDDELIFKPKSKPKAKPLIKKSAKKKMVKKALAKKAPTKKKEKPKQQKKKGKSSVTRFKDWLDEE
jgi:uncharacterized membrane protein